MRKVIISFAVILFFSFTSNISAQEETSNEYRDAYAVYTQSIGSYNQIHEEYITARARYLQFKTQTAETEAKDKTTLMLQSRDQVIIDYLKALSMRIGQMDGLNDSLKLTTTTKIDNEISWYENHKNELIGAGTLEDLEENSNSAKSQFVKTNELAYEALSLISYGKINDEHERLDDLLGDLKIKLESIRGETRPEYTLDILKLQKIDRWMLESDARMARSRGKLDNSLSIIYDSGKKVVGLTLYTKVITELTQSKQFLKETSQFLLEIVREVKTK